MAASDTSHDAVTEHSELCHATHIGMHMLHFYYRIGIAGLWWALHSFFIGRSLVFLVLLKLRMPELFARVDAGA